MLKITTLAAILAILPLSVGAQPTERKNGQVIAADFNYNARSRCIWTQHSYTVSAKLFVRFQPDQRLAAGQGADVSVTPAAGKAPPIISVTVSGAADASGARTAPEACHAEAAQGVAGPAAACTLSDGPGGMTLWSFTLPVTAFGQEVDTGAKTYTGHVTLMKRGDDQGRAKIVAPCASSGNARGAKSAGYDLAVSKKV